METKSVNAGDLLIRRESAVDTIWYITEGRVSATFGMLKIILKKGDFIGIADFNTGIHSFEYTAVEPTKIVSFCTRDALFSNNFFSSKPENARALALSLNHIVRNSFLTFNSLCTRSGEITRFVNDSYENYIFMARELHLNMRQTEGIDDIPEAVDMGYSHKCLYQYHKGISMRLTSKEAAADLIRDLVIPGYMYHSVDDLGEIVKSVEYVSGIVEDCNLILINDSHNDLLDAYNELYIRAGEEHSLSASLMDNIKSIYEMARETDSGIKKDRIEELKKKSDSLKNVADVAEASSGQSVESKLYNSMDQILTLTGFDPEIAKQFKQAVSEYKNMADPNSTEDDARKVRKEIESYFYQLYLSALEVSIENPDQPELVKMFLNFGYLDEELAGMNNAIELYDMVKTFEGRPSQGVYTGYEWLVAIFNGQKDPSINEFDQTYEQFIKEQADGGRIPLDQLKLYLADRGQMVMFELQNMFRHASRITSGHILNFCPIFCEHQILRSAKEDFIDAQTLIEARDAIRNIDYTLFYRETVFVYNKKENIHDLIHVEILPDMILLPVVGCRGSMWQEISSRDKMTPARMMLPVFNVESLEKALLRIFGEYRWEMCKRIQGVRWNDVTDPSLTSLYYDYLQFYRKNSEISMEQKEKIKIGLQRNRNSYKEFFISDYSEYIRYESNGSPHLIKTSRSVLYAQCPFSSSVRRKLSANPIYSDLNEKYNLKAGQHLHKLENIRKKLNSKGLAIPAELDREVAFYGL